MPLQNPGTPISLSQVQTQFGGANPISLSEYYSGGTYVPTGTTNYFNTVIPTSTVKTISLHDFYGAPQGIQLSTYINNLLQYNRNSAVATSTPALQDLNNNNAYNENNLPNGGVKTLSGIHYQTFTYSNSALISASGCTVVYSIAGQMENNSAKVGIATGGAGALAQTATWTEALYVYAGNHLLAPSYVHIDYGVVSANVATAVAQYNCSPTAITKIIGSFDSGNTGHGYSTYSALQIIPGHWQISATTLLQSNVTTNSVIPPNTFQLTTQFMQKNGNVGNDNDNSMATPAGIGLSIQYSDHWYVNAAFQWNFNSGTSNVTSTQYTTKPYECGVVYQFAQGGPGGNGLNTTSGANIKGFGAPFISNVTANNGGTVTIVFTPDGGAYGTSGSAGTMVTYAQDSSSDVVWGWYYGATLTGTNPGNSYWLKATLTTSTDDVPGGTLNTWIPMSSNITYSLSSPLDNAISHLSFQIATDSAGTNAVTLGSCTLYVGSTTNDSGGGGGGGSCVSIDSFMPLYTGTAGDVKVGETLVLADPETLHEFDGVVEYSKLARQPGFRIVTMGGATLKCSNTAPIPVRGGQLKTPEELLGEEVAVKRDNRIEYEKVTEVTSVGMIDVQHISVDDRCFWAGEQNGVYILHHNKVAQDQR